MGRHLFSRCALAAAAFLAFAVPAPAFARAAPQPKWVGAWASAQILVDEKNALPPEALKDSTLRQLVRTTVAGSRLRIRVSNALGTTPLTISGIRVARALSPDSSRIDASTDSAVTFAGAREITIPAGAEFVSDPVRLRTPALATLAVSIHFPELPKLQTGHPGSRATSYLSAGDQLSVSELSGARTVDHWYLLAAVDVEAPAPSAAIAVLGDSITDGYGVKPNTNSRWPDFLAERLKRSPATRSLGVLNLGIGGNRILNDGIGPNALARFDRDVLKQSGIRYLVILEGVNDLGVLTRDAPVAPAEHKAFVRRVLTGYAQMVAQARERGIKVIGATILPYGGSAYYHPDASNEADRQAINAWIRTRGNVDAVIDFDAVMRDPARPQLLRKEYDSGDGLHPSIAGYRAMGEAVPLSLFTSRRDAR